MYARAHAKVEREINTALIGTSRRVTTTVSTFESTRELLRRMPTLVASFDRHRHVRAKFTTVTGNTITQTEIDPRKRIAPRWFHLLFADTSSEVTIELPEKARGVGNLIIFSDPQNEVDEAWSYLAESFLILLTLCSAVLLLIYWQLHRSLRPLENLSRALGEIGPQRSPTPVPESGPMELQQVYRGFNKMIAGLSDAEKHNRRLNKQLAEVQEEERVDLARDLHDEIGPFLFAVDVDASTIKKMDAIENNEDVAARIDSIRDAVKHMQGIVKSLLARLRPGTFLDLGLAPAVDNLISFWRDRHPDIKIRTIFDLDDFGEELNGTLYRIIQEALSNAIRHGTPKQIDVSVTIGNDDRIHASITDDGGGSDNLDQSFGSGFGLLGMRERVESLGGIIKITNRDDIPGVRVDAWIDPDAVLSDAATSDFSSDTTKIKTEAV